ncbi:MAG: small ribosomal subunit Rsm22 family protein [Treponema sp.]|nr:small ribosomal subunit Rsm22 family protein [Treponema sp.]
MDLLSLNKHVSLLLSLWTGRVKNPRLDNREISKVGNALLRLQRGLTGDRNLAGAGYMNDHSLLGAYLLYYWNISYFQMWYILDKNANVKAFIKACAKKSVEQKKPVHLLDFGSGPGPVSCAVMDKLLEADKNCYIKLDLVDYSRTALSYAQKHIKAYYKNVDCKIWQADFERQKLSDFLSDGYDLIFSCHALNELWKHDNEKILRRTDFIEDVASLMKETGLMILCEPALLETSRSLLKVRDKIIEKGIMSAIAPCSSLSTVCPALAAGENHTCHCEYPCPKVEPMMALAKVAKLDRESVKMTYVAFSKDFSLKAADDNNLMFKDEGQLSGRIVSDGMLNKAGRLRFLICDGKCRIPVSAKNGDAIAREKGFFSLKRMDKVIFKNLEKRGDAKNISYGIKSDTIIKLVD